jgi:hypothetical protein
MRIKLIGAAAIAATLLSPMAAALAQALPPPPGGAPGVSDDWLLHRRGAAPAPGGAPGAHMERHADGDRWRHRNYGAGVAGLAAGALLGGALAASQQGYYSGNGYYADAPVDDGYRPPEADSADAEDYCFRTYRSYDPESRTYLGYDGYRHPCP